MSAYTEEHYRRSYEAEAKEVDRLHEQRRRAHAHLWAVEAQLGGIDPVIAEHIKAATRILVEQQ